MTASAEGWEVACGAGEVEEGVALGVLVGTRRICLVRHEGELFAIDDVCTHGQALLSEGFCDTDECALECPLHGGLVDFRTGKAMTAPIEKDARTYAVRIEGDQILVATAPR